MNDPQALFYLLPYTPAAVAVANFPESAHCFVDAGKVNEPVAREEQALPLETDKGHVDCDSLDPELQASDADTGIGSSGLVSMALMMPMALYLDGILTVICCWYNRTVRAIFPITALTGCTFAFISIWKTGCSCSQTARPMVPWLGLLD